MTEEDTRDRFWFIFSVPEHIRAAKVKNVLDEGLPGEVEANQINDTLVAVGVGDGYEMKWVVREDLQGIVNFMHDDVDIIITPKLEHVTGESE